MNHIYTTRKTCRVCDGALDTVWDLGLQFIYSLKQNNAAPITLTVCEKCELVQLKHTVNPDMLYKDEYYYKSGVNKTMRAALWDVVESAQRYVGMVVGDKVVDIGANDGTLLNNYPLAQTRVAFEPSSAGMDIPNSILWIKNYFSAAEYKKYFEKPAKVITACAMFYDLENPLAFLQDVSKVLADDGVFIIQMNYLKSMVDNCNFDSISHEHLCYYSIRDMIRLTKEAGLCIEDAELNQVNGGSIRLYIRRVSDKPIGQSDRIAQLREQEREWYEERIIQGRIADMRHRAELICTDLFQLIKDKRACAVGASTRGYVILQLAGLELPLIDRNPDKVGRSLGNMIIKGEECIDDYEIGIVLPYHFMDEMVARYKDKKIKLINAIRPV